MPDTISLSPEESKFFETQGGEAGDFTAPAEVPAPASEPVPAPTPAAEVQPELPLGQAKPAAAAEPEVRTDAPKDPVLVPVAELQHERKRRQEEAKKREDAEKQYLTLNARLETLASLARAQQAPPPEVPDVNIDPIGHFRAENEALKRQLNEQSERTKKQEEWRTQQETQAQTVNNVQRLLQLAGTHEQEYRAKTPDYDAASTYLRQQRDRELEIYGMTDPIKRQETIGQDAINIAAQALATGGNVANVIYEMAKSRGYRKAEPAAAPVPAPVVPPAPAVTEEKKVQMAAGGQKASASIGQMPGAAAPPVTLDAIAKMSDKDFEEATKGDKWRKLFT